MFQVSAAEHLRKLEKLDEAAQKVMNAESKAYLSRLHTRKLEEDAARKEREMRRRKVMLEQDAAQDALEEKRREDLILAKLARQCAEEVKIGEQMWVARKEKEVMRKNRQLRDEQLQEEERLAAIERRERDHEIGLQAREEYEARLAREKERAEENERARQAVKHQQHEATCRAVAEQLAALAARVVDFRATTQPLLPPKVMRDWLTLFKAGLPLEPPGLDTPHAEELPEGDAEGGDAAPAPADETVNTAELDAYLERSEDWAVDVLQGKQIPEEEEAAGGALLASETLVPIPEEAGCAQTGRMVLEFIETCMPPPPPATGAGLPVNLTKVAIIGRPFAGKSLQAQRLAEAHRLLVVMPQEVVEQALAAATTYDENVAAATALDEDAAAAAAEAGEELAEPPNSAAAIVPPATLDLANAARAALPGPVPDEVLVGLIVETIRNVDQVSYSGVVLDGFPRTEAQARALEKALTGFEPPPKEPPKKGSKIAPPPDEGDEPKAPHVPGIDCVIRLDVPDEMCRRRALGRRLDPQTGEVYHLEFAPPPDEHEPGLNERLVPVEGAADQEASLPAALVAYADGEAALEQWFTDLGLLVPINGEAALAEVGDAVAGALTGQLTLKEERVAAKKAFEDEAAAAAAAAAAEAEAAAAAEAEAAAAAAAAEEAGEPPPDPIPATAAAPAALPSEASEVLFGNWKALEEGFLSAGCASLASVRELQWRAHQRVCSSRKEFVTLLTAPDAREREALDAQERFNAMPTELRLSEGGKAELHMIATDLQETLYALSDQRRTAAEKAMGAMAEDGWLQGHALQLVLATLTLAQGEADRFSKTCAVLHSYCCLRSERNLPFTAPPLAELPVVDAVDISVPVPGDADGAEAAAAPAKGKAPPAKGGAPPTGSSPEATLVSALNALVTSHCEPIEEAEAPPPAEETATAEAKRAAEWATILHSALVGERAKLRRRLACILRYGIGQVADLRDQIKDLYAQLDGWLGERQRSEAAAGASLVTILRRAVEDEVSLPHALQLQGDELVIDESLLVLPPPPPPPVPKPSQPPIADRFTVVQLAGLATKMREASSSLRLSAEATEAIFCRLGAAGFDAASPPLPEAWWPLGPPAYAKLTGLFCADGAPELAWPEVVLTLAAITPPTEDQLVANLTSAAKLLGREDLLPQPPPEAPAAEGDAAAAPPPALPARASLLLDHEAYDSLPLWFEEGATPQADGYSVEGALKALLFDMLADSTSGKLDLQQLLLYACDGAEKAFAVLGFASSKMLTLDGLYELLHREPAVDGVEPPEHLDPFSRAALKRLFVELKLGEAERAPFPLVSKHPAGAALLGACPSYVPKDVYGLVSDLVNNAGASLKI